MLVERFEQFSECAMGSSDSKEGKIIMRKTQNFYQHIRNMLFAEYSFKLIALPIP